MAFKCIELTHDHTLNIVKKTFVLDSEEDLVNLPACSAGSMAIVASGGKIFMVNASGEWVNFNAEE